MEPHGVPFQSKATKDAANCRSCKIKKPPIRKWLHAGQMIRIQALNTRGTTTTTGTQYERENNSNNFWAPNR
jgi:hypothetical protein